MKMDEMNKWFEDKGFEVKREYKTLGTRGYYEFTISKNDNHVVGTYSWPEDQPSFMRRMVKSYENEFGKDKLELKSINAAYGMTIGSLWTDGTKTVVKCQDGDVFDAEKGLALAISKKAFGNKGNYCNELKKWLPKKYLCMYCGAETTNDSWDHICDECKNEPLDPIKDKRQKSAVQKAYDAAINIRDIDTSDCDALSNIIHDVIGYLGEALED